MTRLSSSQVGFPPVAALVGLSGVLCLGSFLAGVWPFHWGTSPPVNTPSASVAIRLLAVSNDGHFLDVAQGDAHIVRRDALTGREFHKLRFPRSKLPWLQFCGGDGTWVGLNQHSELEIARGNALLWQGTLPDQQPREFLMHCSLCLRRRLIAVVSEAGSLWLLDFDEQRAVPRRRYTFDELLTDVKLSPTGEQLVLVTDRRQFLFWNIAQEQVVAQLETEGEAARYISWSGDGRRLITCGESRELAVWEASTGRLVRRWSVDAQLVFAAELSHDGTRAAVGDGNVIRLWDVETGVELPSLTGHRGMLTVVQFADGDRSLFSGDNQGSVRRWSLSDGREIWAAP